MTSSMPIPTMQKQSAYAEGESSPCSSPSSYGSSPGTSTFLSSSKGKQRASDSSVSSSPPRRLLEGRRPSLLGSHLSQSVYTVVNLGHSDGPTRLVTCVKSSQGFDWNQELFIPSYADHDSHDLEHRPDPVEEIVLTDEEAAAMLPQ